MFRPLILVRKFSTSPSIKDKLIRASFLHAKTHGFTDQAVTEGCRDLDLPSVSAAILDNGPYDVVTFAMDQWLSQMKEDVLEHENFHELRIPEKIKLSVRTRLELMSPLVDKWPQAMALGLKPQNLPTTMS